VFQARRFLFFLVLITGLTLCVLSLDAEAADYTSTGSGDWDVLATWGGSGTPGSGDTVTIANTHTVTLTQNEGCDALMVNSGGIVDTVSFDLTISGAVTLYDVLDGGSGSHVFGSLIIMNGGAYSATSGTTAVNGDFKHYTGGTFTHNDGTVTMTAGTLEGTAVDTAFHIFQNTASITYNKDCTFESYVGMNATYFRITNPSPPTLTLGDGSSSKGHLHCSGERFRFTAIKVYGSSATNFAAITGSDWRWGHEAGSTNLKWLDFQFDVDTATGGGNARTITLDGDCEFDSLSINADDTLNLNGNKATLSRIFTDSGTLTSGTTSEIELLAGSSWTMNHVVTLKALYVNGTAEVQENVTFTATEGFSNSSGELYINGTVGDLIYISGPHDWIINASALSDYGLWYANFSEGNNIGSATLVGLGEGYNLSGSWDFSAPVITSHVISEGYEQDLYDNTTLIYDWTATDLTFLFEMNFTVYCQDNNTLMVWGDLNLTTNETASNRWDLTTTISTWTNGSYNITFRTSDCHNPARTKEAKEKAEKMTVIVGGEVVGKKHKKETEFVPGLVLIFNNDDVFLEEIFIIEFLGTTEQDLEHKVKWKDQDKNFKIYHRAKVGMVEGEKKNGDAGLVPQILGVKMRISAESLEYIPRSEYLGHFLINGAYFYDCQDFADEGGSIIVYEKERSEGTESYTLIFTHPGWKRNEWVTIDPMSGSINTNSETYNWTLINEAPAGVDSLEEFKQGNDEDQDRANIVIPLLVAASLTISAAGVIYLLTTTDSIKN